MNDIRLPLPKSRPVLLRKSRRLWSKVESRPLDSAHITDEDREGLIQDLKGCSASNSARPALMRLTKIILGRKRLEEEGLL